MREGLLLANDTRVGHLGFTLRHEGARAIGFSGEGVDFG
jgi:hypothetical protein